MKEVRFAEPVFNVLQGSAAEVVEDENVDSLRHKGVHDVATDEASSANYQYSRVYHVFSTTNRTCLVILLDGHFIILLNGKEKNNAKTERIW